MFCAGSPFANNGLERTFSGLMLDKQLNALSHQIIGIAIDIHKKLGGFQEKIYPVVA